MTSRVIGAGSPLAILVIAASAFAQEPSQLSAADQAFEAGEWARAIDEFRALTVDSPDNGMLWLRIAQAQRELNQHAPALDTLQRAREALAPEAMVELERARNLVELGQSDTALRALDSADHLGLRALDIFDTAREFDALRSSDTFQRVYRSVRSRVYPCEGLAEAREFDFWLGRWDVRLEDGTLVGHNSITKDDGGCMVLERWDGAGGSTGTSVNYYQPSSGRWHQLWVGSNGTLIDIAGGLRDGVMRLEGTIEYVAEKRIEAFRGSWSVLADGRVRQHFEEFNLIAQSWQTWFDGYYEIASGR